jgi:hypothetical protein
VQEERGCCTGINVVLAYCIGITVVVLIVVFPHNSQPTIIHDVA